uniref:Uncharacterized protein n=1 Tax=Leviviridae sp. TaxID=2027243 RepID=A0A514CYV0_9VIRU|nr:MAG: hypothetical protein H2RhizoLitter8298_000002 [Leviviridae sp.]
MCALRRFANNTQVVTRQDLAGNGEVATLYVTIYLQPKRLRSDEVQVRLQNVYEALVELRNATDSDPLHFTW